MRELMPRTPFLLPGIGAQGGDVGALGPAFAPGRAGGLVTASRSIANAYETHGGDPATAARAEAERLREPAWASPELIEGAAGMATIGDVPVAAPRAFWRPSRWSPSLVALYIRDRIRRLGADGRAELEPLRPPAADADGDADEDGRAKKSAKTYTVKPGDTPVGDRREDRRLVSTSCSSSTRTSTRSCSPRARRSSSAREAAAPASPPARSLAVAAGRSPAARPPSARRRCRRRSAIVIEATHRGRRLRARAPTSAARSARRPS